MIVMLVSAPFNSIYTPPEGWKVVSIYAMTFGWSIILEKIEDKV
jgi:hypothetical protein